MPLCVCVYVCLCVCVCVYIHIYHIFLCQLLADGHMGCFHYLAVINRAAVNIECMCLLKLAFSFFPDVYPGVELLDHVVVPF